MSTSSRFAVAVHMLTMIARSGDEPVKSEALAESVNTNPVVIRRLLCELSKAELVSSQKGSLGGSRLAKAPEEITLFDIYKAVEPKNLFSMRRQKPSGRCPVGGRIETVLGDVLTEVNSAVEGVLLKRTMAEIVERTQECVNVESET
jgi:Rrf2 family protein